MVSPIDAFPAEVLENVVAYLSYADVSRFMRTSKSYHAFLERILWTKIETHTESFHRCQTHGPLRKELSLESRNRQCRMVSPVWQGGYSTVLMQTLSRDDDFGKGLSEARIVHLGSLITWLCLTIQARPKLKNNVKRDVWNPFSNLVNLSYLELIAPWTKRDYCVPFTTPSTSKGALTRLRTLKLRGYLDRDFVQWLLKDPTNIEELELGVLDVPISCDFLYPQHRLSADEHPKWGTAENYEHEVVAPRSLACLTPQITRRLSSIRKIHLIRPTRSYDIGPDLGTYGCTNPYFSWCSEDLILQEWKDLIRTTRRTLEYIVLDHRPVACAIEPATSENCEFMPQAVNGHSYLEFVDIVLPVLLRSSEFPVLRTIRTFGFEAYKPQYSRGEEHPVRLYKKDSVDVPGQLQAAFPDALVTDHVGRRMLMDEFEGDGTLQSYGELEKTSPRNARSDTLAITLKIEYRKNTTSIVRSLSAFVYF